jgi:7-cyano-7-deazaguanine synthase
VPGRNLIFIAHAASVAESVGAGFAWFAMHAGDHPIYPDCRPEFLQSARNAVEWSTEHRVSLRFPFISKPKADIVVTGNELRVPFRLTWSCYQGGDEHCGRCGTCVERAEAFAVAGVADPTSYRDAEYWKGVVMP